MSRPANDAASFDARYLASADPWGVADRTYEFEKSDRTLEALPRRRMRRALEMGCGTGALTERLARRSRELLAVDFSSEAVRLTRQRADRLDHVQVRCGDLRRNWPSGPWDLVLCSEVLYYWTPGEVTVWLARVERSLALGGVLLCVHWTGDDPAAPMDGFDVHALLREQTSLTPSLSAVHDGYVLDRFDAL